jgi:hypothetical protein
MAAVDEWLPLLGAALLGFLLDRLAVNWSRLTGRLPVDVVIETDPAVFLAGEPNWDGFSFVFPGRDIGQVGPAPAWVCREWHRWAMARGGVHSFEQRIRVAVIPRGEATVLVEAFEPEVVSRTQIPRGAYVTCAVGGADGRIRHISVDLVESPPWTTYRGDEGEEVQRFKLTIGKGDAERFEIVAKADPGSLVEWRGRLHVIANGKKKTITIDDEGKPLRLSGPGSGPYYMWRGDGWEETPSS